MTTTRVGVPNLARFANARLGVNLPAIAARRVGGGELVVPLSPGTVVLAMTGVIVVMLAWIVRTAARRSRLASTEAKLRAAEADSTRLRDAISEMDMAAAANESERSRVVSAEVRAHVKEELDAATEVMSKLAMATEEAEAAAKTADARADLAEARLRNAEFELEETRKDLARLMEATSPDRRRPQREAATLDPDTPPNGEPASPRSPRTAVRRRGPSREGFQPASRFRAPRRASRVDPNAAVAVEGGRGVRGLGGRRHRVGRRRGWPRRGALPRRVRHRRAIAVAGV